MNEIERKKWAEVRAKGGVKYVIKTSLISLLFIIALFFVSNAFRNRERLDVYLEHNLNTNLTYNLIVIGITYVGILIASAIVWKVNEKRFNKSQK